jgi:hypothetical protein
LGFFKWINLIAAIVVYILYKDRKGRDSNVMQGKVSKEGEALKAL